MNSCDQDFAVIQAKCFHYEIIVPSQWIEIIKNAKRESQNLRSQMTGSLEKYVINKKDLQMARNLNGLT